MPGISRAVETKPYQSAYNEAAGKLRRELNSGVEVDLAQVPAGDYAVFPLEVPQELNESRATRLDIHALRGLRSRDLMRPYSLMLWGAFAFAVMGAFTHAAAEHYDWQVIALARSILALMIAGLLAVREKTSMVFFRPPTLWVRSIAGSLSVMCNFYALSRLPIADALTLTNMFPVWIAVLSWPVLGRFPERDVWFGVLCGVMGVAVMQQPYLAEGNLGTLAAVTGSVTSAVALIGLHRLRHIAPNAIVVHFSAVSVLVVLTTMLIIPSEHALARQLTVSWPAPAYLLGVGISATIGQLLLTRAFAAGAPARISVIGLTQVGFAMVFDVIFWNRSLQIQSILGMLLVIGPTVWLMLRGDSRNSSNSPGPPPSPCEPSKP